ncbi:MAG: hypothetical protein COB50_03605, partial [Thiotrichales bacterium]
MSNLALLIIYLGVLLAVSLWRSVGKAPVKSFHDYAIGGAAYTTTVIVLVLFINDTDSCSIAGIISKVYEHGVSYILVFLGMPISKLLIAKFIAPRMALYKDMITVGDILQYHYGSFAKISAGVAGVILNIGYISVQIMALRYLGEYFFEVPAVLAMALSCTVIA